jgi:predicted O-linked N-acetylglucosamine transferase (SPINDLY family)
MSSHRRPGSRENGRSGARRSAASGPAALATAVRLHESGRLAEAEAAYRSVIAAHPRDHRAWANLGSVLGGQGRTGEAAEALRRAVSLAPLEVEFHLALARALLEEGDEDGAAAAVRAAVALDPPQPPVWSIAASVLTSTGHPDEAIEVLAKAVERHPRSIDLRRAFIDDLVMSQRLDEAVAAAAAAVADFPLEPAAHLAQWSTMVVGDQVDAGYQAALRAVALNPDDWFTNSAVGLALAGQGRVAAAAGFYERAMSAGAPPSFRFRDALLLPMIPRSSADLEGWRERYRSHIAALEADPPPVTDPVAEVGHTPFLLAYQGHNNRDLQESLARAYIAACPSLSFVAPHVGDGRPTSGDDRIRLGIASWNMRLHTIGKVNLGIISHLDRERFHVTLVLGPRRDVWSEEAAGHADEVIWGRDELPTLRRRVADAALDVLFYPDIGMDPVTNFLAFSRLAPVQATTWGHPDTTGIPAIDYYVSAAPMEPADATSHYSETLVELSSIPTYYRPPPVPSDLPGRSALPFEDDWTVYACVQSLFKVHPEFDELVAGILRADPTGRVVFVDAKTPHPSELLAARFEETVPDVADRILFLPRLSEINYFNLLVGADVLLDTTHFGGGSTTYESLAVGAPVVTWPRRMARSRVTAALLQRVGAGDLIASSAAEYVEIALRLGSDLTYKADVSARIEQGAGAVFEDEAVVRELETFFADALARTGW